MTAAKKALGQQMAQAVNLVTENLSILWIWLKMTCPGEPEPADFPKLAMVRSFPKDHTQNQLGKSMDRKMWYHPAPFPLTFVAIVIATSSYPFFWPHGVAEDMKAPFISIWLIISSLHY